MRLMLGFQCCMYIFIPFKQLLASFKRHVRQPLLKLAKKHYSTRIANVDSYYTYRSQALTSYILGETLGHVNFDFLGHVFSSITVQYMVIQKDIALHFRFLNGEPHFWGSTTLLDTHFPNQWIGRRVAVEITGLKFFRLVFLGTFES
ncbi:unnamed protein product [Acanthoscelides obtectus]|uniref:Uncharacterized protein n=1 Tax=Acanthoscelides obtectus TaxID=200917 RepID=A0A9P0K772_ACAOB|nr:unnamed protein product [Acanthoscelides obtectus]CAK1652368.1 hypothetical protein AOBTE_LOCUS17809 [Acanthoscelides obtectus]